MPLLPRRRRTEPPRPTRLYRPALTAAADRVNRQSGQSLRKLHQAWQQRALTYYDTVGECWYPAQFYARSFQKIRFFPALLNDQGEPEEVTDGPLADLFDRVQDPGGGRGDLVGAYGRLMFLIGDGYLTVTNDADDDGEAWEFLSPLELRIKPGGRPDRPQEYQRLRAPGLTPEELVEASDNAFEPLAAGARVYRLWRRHPMYTALADSPVRAVLDLYELLYRLTLAASAEASNRAANRGLLFVPDDLTIEPANPGVDEDPDEDPVMRELTEGLAAAIENPGDASAMAPFVLRGPGALHTPNGAVPMKDALFWMKMGPDDRYHEGEMWEKTIIRIGNGLDLPLEFVTGVGSANHWGAWILDEQGFRQHVAPVAQRFCDDIASAYLRPAARDAGLDWRMVTVGADPAEAINHPDQVGTAKDAHDRLVISDQAYREAAGFNDEHVPDDDELERRILIMLKRTPPGVGDDEEADGETAPSDGGRGDDTNEQAPAAPTNGDRPGRAADAAVAAARIIGASELQVERARELAGQRLRNRSQGCDHCRDQIKGVPAMLVAATLGPATVREIIDGHTTEPALVRGAGDALATTLASWGVADQWAAELGQLVEQHALRSLYEPHAPALPSGFAAAVAKALR